MLNVWKIDYAAVHDGPGIRTSVYLKGCPLRCLWCSNPEGQSEAPNLIFTHARCIDCGLCQEACPHKAIVFYEDSGTRKPEVNRGACDLCGNCVSVCSPRALEIWGKAYVIPELLEIVEKNRAIYRKSGGGITLTGGDPIHQPESIFDLLDQCRRRGIHTAMETCAYGNSETFERILERIDWLFIDLKHMDPDDHLRLTGKKNDLILENVKRASSVLTERNRDLVIRMVVVPGINDGENIHRTGEFLRGLPYIKGVELLPYHHYGIFKYGLLNRFCPMQEIMLPSDEMMADCKETMRNFGIHVIDHG